MNNKKGLQLSLNMIIVIVISLVFLGIAISLITNWFHNTDMPDVPSQCEIYPPKAGSPVCVKDEVSLSRGDTANLKVAFYNNEDDTIPASESPNVNCQSNVDNENLDLKATGSGQELPVGEYKDYNVIVKIPKDAPRGTFPCTLSLGNTDESFVISVE